MSWDRATGKVLDIHPKKQFLLLLSLDTLPIKVPISSPNYKKILDCLRQGLAL